MNTPPRPGLPVDVVPLALVLAEAHGAATLAAALVVRLRAEGRGDLAASIEAAVGILNPNPPDPHKATGA